MAIYGSGTHTARAGIYCCNCLRADSYMCSPNVSFDRRWPSNVDKSQSVLNETAEIFFMKGFESSGNYFPKEISKNATMRRRRFKNSQYLVKLNQGFGQKAESFEPNALIWTKLIL